MEYIHGRIAFGPELYGENTSEEARSWIEERQMKYHPNPVHETRP
jgi:hypothetical protein